MEAVKQRFKDTKFQLIVTAMDAKGAICENSLTSSFVPFELLFQLKRVGVVSSGGLNTTLQAIASGVPHLVVPTQLENVYNGFIAKQLGVAEK